MNKRERKRARKATRKKKSIIIINARKTNQKQNKTKQKDK